MSDFADAEQSTSPEMQQQQLQGHPHQSSSCKKNETSLLWKRRNNRAARFCRRLRVIKSTSRPLIAPMRWVIISQSSKPQLAIPQCGRLVCLTVVVRSRVVEMVVSRQSGVQQHNSVGRGVVDGSCAIPSSAWCNAHGPKGRRRRSETTAG